MIDMKITMVFIMMAACASSALALIMRCETSLDLVARSDVRPDLGFRYYRLSIYIENDGNVPVVLPTSGYQPVVSWKGSELSVFAIFSLDRKWGKPLKHPDSLFCPVRVMPGELTEVRYLLRIPVSFDDIFVRVTYEVPEDVAEHYEFWHGKLTGSISIKAEAQERSKEEQGSASRLDGDS